MYNNWGHSKQDRAHNPSPSTQIKSFSMHMYTTTHLVVLRKKLPRVLCQEGVSRNFGQIEVDSNIDPFFLILQK